MHTMAILRSVSFITTPNSKLQSYNTFVNLRSLSMYIDGIVQSNCPHDWFVFTRSTWDQLSISQAFCCTSKVCRNFRLAVFLDNDLYQMRSALWKDTPWSWGGDGLVLEWFSSLQGCLSFTIVLFCYRTQ